MNDAVAKALGAERVIAGLTVRKLSELSGIPERSLMRILQGEREIKVNQVEQLSEALRLYPHEIIEHAETILERASRSTPALTNVTHAQFGGAEDVGGSQENGHLEEEKKVAKTKSRDRGNDYPED